MGNNLSSPQFGDLESRIAPAPMALDNRGFGVSVATRVPHHVYGDIDPGVPMTSVQGAAAVVAGPRTFTRFNRDAVAVPDNAPSGARYDHEKEHGYRTMLNNEQFAEERATQPKMFGMGHAPPVLDILAASEQAPRHAAHAALGLAAMESHARYGQYPEASSDLSLHSAPIVRRLADAGVIKAPEQFEDASDLKSAEKHPGKPYATNSLEKSWGNQITHEVQQHAAYAGGPESMRPQSYANLGRQFMSNALRPKRDKPAAVASKQGTLF
jgi:hypothetical protein